MKKLIKGIVEFRRKKQKGYVKSFSSLATQQSPDSLFIACSDSRVVPNTFASTNPGDLFVVRNVGNILPPSSENGLSVADESEMAAIEFSILHLNVNNIIICGHSDCGAMAALLAGRNKVPMPHLKNWLRHGETSLERLRENKLLHDGLNEQNLLSQHNVLVQMENIKSYPIVRERMAKGQLSVHGWWFELSHADVYSYEESLNKFILIDEAQAKKLLADLARQTRT